MRETGISVAVCLLATVLLAAGCSEMQEKAAASDPYIVKDIKVVYQCLIKEGDTCTRCEQTGVNMDKAAGQLQKELSPQGVSITVMKKALDEEEILKSNMVLINGEAVENIVPGVRVFYNDCKSCCGMVGKGDIKCRAIEYKGKQYNELPEELIREAILAIAKNLPRPPAPSPPAEGKAAPC